MPRNPFLDQVPVQEFPLVSYYLQDKLGTAGGGGTSDSASYADTASYTPNAVVTASAIRGGDIINFVKGDGSSFEVAVTASNAVITASAVNTTITFTKGDGSTFDVTVSQSGSVATASYALYAVSASYASTASYYGGSVISASYASSSTSASYALTASYATNTISASTSLTASDISPAIINNDLNRLLLATGTGKISGSTEFTYDPGEYAFRILNSNLIIGDVSNHVYAGTDANSIAQGQIAVVNGYNAYAQGNTVTANGNNSHAEGNYTTADGESSHAEGYGTTAISNYQHAQGTYNLIVSGTGAFILGNGTNDLNRSNLIFASGSLVQVTGSVIATQGFTGSLSGTSSWAVSASFSSTASYVKNAQTASYVLQAISASYASSSISASYALTASYALNGNAFPYTGSALITGSLGITGSLSVSQSLDTSTRQLYNSSNIATVNWGNNTLFDNIGTQTVDWNNVILYDNFNINSLAWGQRLLYDFSGTSSISIDWGNRWLTNTSQIPVIQWEDYLINDPSGTSSIDWSNRRLNNIKGDTVLSWTGNSAYFGTPTGLQIDIKGNTTVTGSIIATQGFTGSLQGTASWASNAVTASYALNAAGASSFPYTGSALITGSLGITGSLSVSESLDTSVRQLYNSSNIATVDWGNNALYDNSNTTSVTWGERTLIDSSGTVSADWASRTLNDSSSVLSVDWDRRRLGNIVSNKVLDWDKSLLVDNAGTSSVDWTTRRLLNSSGNTILDWSTVNKIAITGSVNATQGFTGPTITGSTLPSGSLTLSSTSDAIKGKIFFGSSTYDELNNRLGIGTTSPTSGVSVVNGSTAQTGLSVTTTATANNALTVTATNAGTAAGSQPASTILMTLNPTSSSATSNRALYMTTQFSSSVTASFTGNPCGGFFETRYLQSGQINRATGGVFTGIFIPSAGVTSSIFITSSEGIQVQGATVNTGSSFTGTFTNIRGIYITQPNKGASSATFTNSVGIVCEALTNATNNTYLLLGTTTSPSGNYGIYSATTNTNYFAGSLQIADKDLILGTTTGTKIGTATSQKLSFWNKTPIVQPTSSISGATFVANAGTAVNDTSTFGGYTIAQIAAALINTGILA